MEASEAIALAQRSLARFGAAGLPEVGAVQSVKSRSIARLWGGMGSVMEMAIQGGPTFVVKRIRMPKDARGIGDVRKRDSYEVEARFYSKGFAERLVAAGCTLPHPLHVQQDAGVLSICMARVEGRSGSMDESQTAAALAWLAKLHAAFWGERADAAVRDGLQPQGGYWYLDTRPDEHESMPTRGWEGRLRLAARAIDARLKAEPMQTVIHGDAKDANMLFSAAPDGSPTVTMYDFQYIGKAPPTKDLAYALTCASNVPGAEEKMLRHYHAELSAALASQGDSPPTLDALRAPLALSYADLGRWMSGWGWWGNDISGKIKAVLDQLDGGTALASEAAYDEAVRRAFPL